MNTDFALPEAKRNYSSIEKTNPFPVIDIPEANAFNERCYTGIFTGLSIEVFDPNDIRELYENGSYGASVLTKGTPKLFAKVQRPQIVNEIQLNRKLEWNEKYQNQNPIAASVQMKQITATEHTFECGAECEHFKVIPDPFPTEETLALIPEEAFFLHHTLCCLKIFNFDRTKEYTTDELIDLFCGLNRKFIERYVAYHYYRSKNWVVKSGMKFGGDFRMLII